MALSLILTLSNLLLLLLWLRLWRVGAREFTFNPLLSGPMRLVDAMIDFLRPVLIGLPPQAIAAVTLLFLLLFRGVLLSQSGDGWTIIIGMSYGRALPVGDWPACMLFSITAFFGFLIRLWGLGFLVAVMTPLPRRDRVSEAFAQFTRPFSLLSRWSMALVLIGLHLLFVVQLQHTGNPLTGQMPGGGELLPLALDWSRPLLAMMQLSWLTALSLAEIFKYAYGAIMGVVLANLVAAIMQNHGLQQLLREAVLFLLGGFGRRPLMIGLIDLSPLAYFFAMNILYGATCGLLRTFFSLMSLA